MLIMMIQNGLKGYDEENRPMWGTHNHARTHTNVGHTWYGQSHIIIHTVLSSQLTLEIVYSLFRTVVQIGKYDRPVPL